MNAFTSFQAAKARAQAMKDAKAQREIEASHYADSQKQQEFMNRLALMKLEAEKNKNQAKNPAMLTPAQKAADMAFGKEYPEWSTTGLTSAEKSIRDLESVRNKVAPKTNEHPEGAIVDETITGGWRGALPQGLKPYLNPESEKIKQQISGALMPSLKVLFPGAVSDDERRALIDQAWNDRLSPEANVANIDSMLKQMKGRLDQAKSQAQYYEDQGTLAGWKYAPATQQLTPKQQAAQAALNDPEATPEEKAKAAEILGMR